MRSSPSLPVAFALALAVTSGVAGCTSSPDETSQDVPTTTPTTDEATITDRESSGGSPSGGSSGGGDSAQGGTRDPGSDLALVQKRKAQMLTSFWENDTTVFQYAFARNNNDGYGYTSGRVGFTTSTGDSWEVVLCFDAAFTGAGNLMKKYEAALKALHDRMVSSGSIQPDISRLDAIGNYTADWRATANNPATAPAFNGCQDRIVDVTYWAPTAPVMKKWGLGTALTRASLYDAMVVHGESNVTDLVRQANGDTGNGAQKSATSPLSQAAESEWLKAFHVHRVALLDSSGAWRGAIARGANYEQLRRDGNFAFTSTIVTSATANVVFPGNDYPSNGYEACVIAPDGKVTGPVQCTAAVSN